MPDPSTGELYIVVDSGENRIVKHRRNTDTEKGQSRSVTKKNDSLVAVPQIEHLLVLSIESEKERMVTMLYVLRSHCCFDFGPTRAVGWPAGYGGMRPRTRYMDDKPRGNHGKDSRTYGASTCKSP
jgi:hypothetical protein